MSKVRRNCVAGGGDAEAVGKRVTINASALTGF
jgi:hypothetical protein